MVILRTPHNAEGSPGLCIITYSTVQCSLPWNRPSKMLLHILTTVVVTVTHIHTRYLFIRSLKSASF